MKNRIYAEIIKCTIVQFFLCTIIYRFTNFFKNVNLHTQKAQTEWLNEHYQYT